MRVIIDRLEENIAVVEIDENGTMLNVPRALFGDAKEGDTVEITVLGRVNPENAEPPHEIFERLRKKSRKSRSKRCTADPSFPQYPPVLDAKSEEESNKSKE